MTRFRISLLAAFMLLWTLPATAAQRVALVIGNSAYTRIAALDSPVNDATLMAAALRRVGFDVIDGTNLTKEAMESAIIDFGRRLRGAGPHAQGLFYYSGHGVQSRGVNYLIPLEAPITQESHLAIKAVPAWWVLDQMDDAQNQLNLVVLDACRNNPFKVGTDKNPIGRGGLQVIDAPTGTLIAYAAAPGKIAYDGRGVNSIYSPFTEALVEAMALPNLQVEDVLKRVRKTVRERTENRQQPWWASSLEGRFAFRVGSSNGASHDTEASAAGPVASDAGTRNRGFIRPVVLDDADSRFWLKVKGNCALVDEYYKRYPNGRHISEYWERRRECAAAP
ncbi:MAG: caspase family protein [Deltaproteobacteria bacterium]|nr:caspase family protein [Deltaproteobacteria bacterium]